MRHDPFTCTWNASLFAYGGKISKMFKTCEDGLNELSGSFWIFLGYVGSLVIKIFECCV